MNKYLYKIGILLFAGFMMLAGCKLPALLDDHPLKKMPSSYDNNTDTTNIATIKWKEYFADPYLVSLIDTALKNNQELSMALQDIEIARNMVYYRKGLLAPTVAIGGGLGTEKVGKYTSQGAGDASADITPGKRVPEILNDLQFGFRASWEADIWGKLHTAQKAAAAKYLGTLEARNYVQTNLVAEIANSYYELLSLDNQMEIVQETIKLQKNALEIVKVLKEATQATELAVKQFEAQVLNSEEMEFDIKQRIAETENMINFLCGRYGQKIDRDKNSFYQQLPNQIKVGIPSQLLRNRPDIRQAEMELTASKLDVKVAQAEFLPSLGIGGGLGLNAFKPGLLFTFPESAIFSLFGEMSRPLINRSAIISEFNNAKSYQTKALLEYQQSILNGYREVSTEVSRIKNLNDQYNKKKQEVETLNRSISISNDLFTSARANYLEVLMAQRDALSAKLEMAELKKNQLNATTNVYKALGGGWN